MDRSLRIVFMGTPEFAVPSLDILVQHGYAIACVVTAPDKPAGRGQQLAQSAIKQYAVKNNIPILQPVKLKDETFLEELRSLNANLFIVVAFRMLPEVVWQMPEFGTFNLHASLLPQYRGAAPFNWALINGEKETGVTTFFLQQEIDTGHILFQSTIPIGDDDNAGTLHDKLSVSGAALVLKTVRAIEKSNYTVTDQLSTYNLPFTTLKQAPKIFKTDCEIDWNRSAREVHNFIRGLSPYPAAFTYLDGKVLKIFNSKMISTPSDQLSQVYQNGKYITDNKSFLHFKCLDAYLDITELQLEGKRKMNLVDFLRGYKFPEALP
jgi:methionyl-tRNA formyltransferase